VDDLRKNQDEAGMMITREYLRGLIQAEIDAGILSERIVLGGFSQGGAMSLLAGLTAKVKLAGVLALSSWLPLDSKFSTLLQEAKLNEATPILMCHGTADAVVPVVLGQQSSSLLQGLGFSITFTSYP
jgi:predicted esterase